MSDHAHPTEAHRAGCPVCNPEKTVPELNEAFRTSKEMTEFQRLLGEYTAIIRAHACDGGLWSDVDRAREKLFDAFRRRSDETSDVLRDLIRREIPFAKMEGRRSWVLDASAALGEPPPYKSPEKAKVCDFCQREVTLPCQSAAVASACRKPSAEKASGELT